MIYDNLSARIKTIEILAPGKRHHWKEESWEGLTIEGEVPDFKEYDYKIEYNTQCDQSLIGNQKEKCIQLLKNSDFTQLNDFKYPENIELWKTYRSELFDIIQSGAIQIIPDKPFGN